MSKYSLEYALLVGMHMRNAQKKYAAGKFTSERLDLLREAKKHEESFDAELKKLFGKKVDDVGEVNTIAKLLNQGKL